MVSSSIIINMKEEIVDSSDAFKRNHAIQAIKANITVLYNLHDWQQITVQTIDSIKE